MNEALTYQAYYTKSDPILNYMTGMLHFHPQDSILEPCGGDGVFVDKILGMMSMIDITGLEEDDLLEKIEKTADLLISK